LLYFLHSPDYITRKAHLAKRLRELEAGGGPRNGERIRMSGHSQFKNIMRPATQRAYAIAARINTAPIALDEESRKILFSQPAANVNLGFSTTPR
jgi:hypothetical protein